MRIVQRQPEDEMPKCEVIFERALRVRSEITSRFPASDTPYIKGVVHSEITGYSQYASTH